MSEPTYEELKARVAELEKFREELEEILEMPGKQ